MKGWVIQVARPGYLCPPTFIWCERSLRQISPHHYYSVFVASSKHFCFIIRPCVFSALEIFLLMCYTNRRFTYLLTYSLTQHNNSNLYPVALWSEKNELTKFYRFYIHQIFKFFLRWTAQATSAMRCWSYRRLRERTPSPCYQRSASHATPP